MVFDTYRAGGNVLPVVSLGGIAPAQGRGLKSVTALYTLLAGESAQVLDPNPRRVWALITNNTLDWCRLAFSATGALAANGHRLDIGGSVVINEQMAWIGAVVVFAPVGGGGCTVTVTEVTIDE